MEMGLRTVQGSVTSAYPTWHDVEVCVELARRSGAKAVLGVGAGSAIDLAKTVSSILNHHGKVDLVLAPATLGASMASMNAHSLLLSQEEEALLPPEFASSRSRNGFSSADATVVLDGGAMAVPNLNTSSPRKSVATVVDAACASLAICLDAAHGLPADDEHISNLIVITMENSLAALSYNGKCHDKKEAEMANGHAISAAVHAGQLLSSASGSSGTRRSIPLALASSLLPRYFPHGHILTFFASMMPALCKTLSSDTAAKGALQAVSALVTGGNNIEELIDWADRTCSEAKIPCMASLAEGTPDVSSMMGKLDANGALLNCEDARSDLVEEILHRSLSR
mmetsp:Transcript_60911/g.180349  ORF Transcript_60911/g.180349 Transcript_60911/m.180349 type:complete len:340 (-) Transcript_60911:25-1044(-)|eukprot:CAMPEP_0113560100 /NCGR_PEP_ID=MMETSP0015_2-20120614/19249_1 /TAXON_ID=2838 /ORGANISM="Odontella" /LENGTH=339 /DNA_ID=CAMNT_0000461779 /DNA_START=515 /DNA_END=1534 /DNA_ORIENTATION=- /assembly_acc=CAM_ASM_000160